MLDKDVLLDRLRGELAAVRAAAETGDAAPHPVGAGRYGAVRRLRDRVLAVSTRERIAAIPVLGYALRVAWSVLRLPRERHALAARIAAAEMRQAETDARLAELDRVAALEARLPPLADAVDRLDRVLANLRAVADEHRIATEKRDAETERRLGELRVEILFQQRRLGRLLARPSAPAALDGVPRPDALDADPAGGDAPPDLDALDALYAAFEERFRGDRAEIERRLEPYLDFVALTGTGRADAPILDIGCGRGEWLGLLGARGLAAYGIDRNEVNVDACRRRGLDVRRADAARHLAGLPDGALGGVTAFHLIEHLPFAAQVALLDEGLRVLVPGGFLLLETPNPENLLVGASTFHNDPTHQRPLPPEVLAFLVEQRGFVEVAIRRVNPYPPDHHLSDGDVAVRLNALLYGPQDYAVLARKP